MDLRKVIYVKQKIILCMLCLVLFLTGCSGTKAKPAQSMSGITEGMESEPIIEYTVPESVPGILINQAGYGPDSTKVAIFRGENLPGVFRVYDAETDAVVFQGNVEPRGTDTVTNEQIGYGDFSELTVEGNYYIRAEIVGYSYTFYISATGYRDLLAANLQHLYTQMKGNTDLNEKEMINACEAVMNLLLACEMHPGAFDDDMGISESGNKIPDSVDVLFLYITQLMNEKETVLASDNWEMVAYYAAAMAKFSYTYKEYDNAFATSCLQLADMAWKHMTQNSEAVDEDMLFMASAELYRASGGYVYHNSIILYGTSQPRALDTREALYGAVTYIDTKQRVNVELCAQFMETISEQAEQISKKSKASYYQVDLTEEQNQNDEILHDMVVLTILNHVISNHEYATVIENHIHYLLGRNPMAISYVDDMGERSYEEKEGQKSVMEGGFLQTAYLFMLSEMADDDIL